ncbi:MAG: DMT family transporter [bacterium]|nr:DMT family transporter [bacterium]
MKKLFTYGPFLIVFAAILWGVDGVLRRSLYTLPPITIVFFEHLIGALLIAPFFLPKLWKEKMNKREWWAILLVSLLSGVLGTLWFTTALAKTGFIAFSVVFLLQKLQPVFTIGTAAIVLKEKVNPKFIGWAVLAIAAAYFVTFPGGVVNLDTGSGTAIAALFAVGAAFAWAVSTSFSRFTLLGHSNTFVTGMRFFLTVPLALITLLLLGESASLTAPTLSEIGRLFIIALSTGMVALWIYYRGLKTTQAKISTILELVFPLTGVFIDIVFFHTILDWSQYFAAAVLLFAVYHVSKLNKSVL